jgi:hypothetical protein
MSKPFAFEDGYFIEAKYLDTVIEALPLGSSAHSESVETRARAGAAIGG